jgi:hypothetical protein
MLHALGVVRSVRKVRGEVSVEPGQPRYSDNYYFRPVTTEQYYTRMNIKVN